MRKPQIRPQADDQATRVTQAVLAFLRANPGERLQPSDIAAKFDCSALGVHSHLGDAVRQGQLLRSLDPDGETAYSLGPNGQPASAAPKPRFLLPDPDTLCIDKDVPMPASKSGIDNTAHYQALLARLGVGDSVLLPLAAKPTLAHAATAWKKATGQQMAIRTSDDGVRVWRQS